MSRGRIALAAAVTVALAGCGGSGSGSSTSSSLSPSSYRASVNKICAAYNDSIRALPKSTTSSVQGLTTLANSAKNALGQIQAVAAPGSLNAAVNKWVASLQQADANVAKLLDAFKSGNATQLRTIAEQGTKLNAQSNAQARALGLSSCAQNATPSG
jgi:hypothetical protein